MIRDRTRRALQETEPLFTPLVCAYRYLFALCRVLENEGGSCGETVRRRFTGTVAMMSRWAGAADPQIREWVQTIKKVSRSYGRGLFSCYDTGGLPRTNNELEQYFAGYRIIERRITGHKVSSPRTVTRGQVRVPAGVCSRTRAFSAEDLVPSSLDAYYRLRGQLKDREEPRREQLRFRRNPTDFLRHLEELSITATLPP